MLLLPVIYMACFSICLRRVAGDDGDGVGAQVVEVSVEVVGGGVWWWQATHEEEENNIGPRFYPPVIYGPGPVSRSIFFHFFPLSVCLPVCLSVPLFFTRSQSLSATRGGANDREIRSRFHPGLERFKDRTTQTRCIFYFFSFFFF